ncbi:MAG: hypothetical protein HY943_19175 [Gammaproteobacteria bacterium]|nr:hypothetical protein [Gammaproteobacteria bacterium]
MTVNEILTITALIAGPVVAVQFTRFLDERKEIRSRKLSVFKTLMATRGYTTTWMHVEALNRIDLEFDPDDKKEKAVLAAWREYLDHLGAPQTNPDDWANRRITLFTELLHKMAAALDYDFDRVQLKNQAYMPKAHGDIEAQQLAVRLAAIEILEGRKPLLVAPVPPPAAQAAAAAPAVAPIGGQPGTGVRQ